MIWSLEAYNTETRTVLYRKYTSSKRLAEKFKLIPKIQFSDSGHGIVFSSFRHEGRGRRRMAGIGDVYWNTRINEELKKVGSQ